MKNVTLQDIQTQIIYLEEGFEALSISERKERIAQIKPLLKIKQQLLQKRK